jgi:hypothetical protein
MALLGGLGKEAQEPRERRGGWADEASAPT